MNKSTKHGELCECKTCTTRRRRAIYMKQYRDNPDNRQKERERDKDRKRRKSRLNAKNAVDDSNDSINSERVAIKGEPVEVIQLDDGEVQVYFEEDDVADSVDPPSRPPSPEETRSAPIADLLDILYSLPPTNRNSVCLDLIEMAKMIVNGEPVTIGITGTDNNSEETKKMGRRLRSDVRDEY